MTNLSLLVVSLWLMTILSKLISILVLAKSVLMILPGELVLPGIEYFPFLSRTQYQLFV